MEQTQHQTLWPGGRMGILGEETLRRYIETFNAQDDEFISRYVPNSGAADFLSRNIPLLDCPDKQIELTYYFRWWTLRKHIRQTEDGFVFTEFLPQVSWAGKHNTIDMAAGLHLLESRWMADRRFAEDYARFWYTGGGDLHGYTNWLPYAAVQLAQVTGDEQLLGELYPHFVQDYAVWKGGVPTVYGTLVEPRENGLFYSYDFFDGGELSLGGHGYRPLFNAAMYSSADSIRLIAERLGDGETARWFAREAQGLRERFHQLLWDEEAQFFKVRHEDGQLSDVKELYGLSPWFFGLPEEGYAAGFRELDNPDGFRSPYGPTCTQQSHPGFRLLYQGHECQWNGPVWPLATSLALGGLENLLNDYQDVPVTPRLYTDLITVYAMSQRRITEEGRILPWIDEDLHPYTGDWISRTCLKTWEDNHWCPGKGGYERGKDYNHSSFCNHVISGLVGIRPRLDNRLVIHPLVSSRQWRWFCLDRVPYHGHTLTVVWDDTGERYPVGPGFTLLVDGIVRAHRPCLEPIEYILEETKEEVTL